jgi:glycosyltransferase involved in cell wall biosynthesis
VGNSYLLDYAKQFNSEVTIAPTSIDTDRYHPRLRRPTKGNVPVIGWTGSYSTYQHLKTAAPALKRLAEDCDFRLLVIGAGDPRIPGVETEVRPWRAESEVEDIAGIDIGIMPLPDDPWSRGKCGLKALQYMALGIPAVVSPVGVNSEIVSDGKSGYLASSTEDWVICLSKLINDQRLRDRLGQAARITVEQRYSVRVVAPQVFDVFQKATLSGPVSASETKQREAS